MAEAAFSLASIQIGTARKVLIAGRLILTAIHKAPVHGPVGVIALGLRFPKLKEQICLCQGCIQRSRTCDCQLGSSVLTKPSW
jgi:hypothetical protein